MPSGSKQASFGFSVANHAGDEKTGVIENRSEGMAQGITKFATLVNGSRGFRLNVTGNATRERELLKQSL